MNEAVVQLFTDYLGLAELAKSRGYKQVWGRHMIPGAPLQWIWEHPKDGFQEPPFGHYPNALANYRWCKGRTENVAAGGHVRIVMLAGGERIEFYDQGGGILRVICPSQSFGVRGKAA